MNIVDPLFQHAAERPEHPAVEDGRSTTSYAELAALVNHAAARLQGQGINAGDIVVVSLNDTVEHIVILCALAKIGAVSFSVGAAAPDMEKSISVSGLSVNPAYS